MFTGRHMVLQLVVLYFVFVFLGTTVLITISPTAASALTTPIATANESNYLHELYIRWINDSKPVVHTFITEAYKLYQLDTFDAYANSFMGLIHYEHQNMSAASAYYKTACKSTSFAKREYVKNFIRAQNLIDFHETVHVLSDALQDDIYNVGLIDTLYDWLSHAIKHHNYPLTELVKLILQLPQMHPFWVLFAETIMETSAIPNLSDSAIARFTLYGLSIFPRSCALQILQATLYMKENNFVCAKQLYESAVRLTYLPSTAFNAAEYLSVLSVYLAAHTTNTTSSHSTGTVYSTESNCIPHLYRHNLAEYQQLYATITATIGSKWTNLSTHHLIPKTRTDIKPIIQHSVSTAYYNNLNGNAESNSVHLPSLQVGCSTPIRCARPGFIIADALETISTHYVTLAYNLSIIESASIGMVYSSHTLEHLSHQLPPITCIHYPHSNRTGDKTCYSELDATLAEWHRVLAYGGLLLVSVPDLAVLSERFVAFQNSTQNMDVVRRILFGGQNDQYDFHKNGFYFEYLKELLLSHKFCEVEKVYQLGLFMDASGTTFTGKDMISLSVRAKKCNPP